MAVEVRVPALGESILEATVGEWLKAEGDAVIVGDPLVELDTEKVAVEVAAEAPGVLERIVHPAGDTVHVGDVLALLADGASAQEATAAAATAPPKETPVERAAGGTEAAPSAPTPPPPAVGDRSDAVRLQSGQPGARAATAPAPAVPGERAPAAPSARRLAAEEGIDLSRVAGSGPSGRITREDVAAQAPMIKSAGAAPAPPPSGEAAAQHPTGDREERVRLSRRRLTIARRLLEAQQTAAILTTFNEVDMSAVMGVRQRRRDAFKERHGVGLGFMSFFTKATVGALRAFPPLNAELQDDTLVLKHYYDIGIAVAAEEGLVVPVVRAADRKSFAEIEREIADLAKRARENALTLEELMGGTFTITNGGVFGSLLSTPILNPPQVGILGMHKIQERPVVVKGQVEVRPMMYVAFSYDHRVVDGREAVQFLVRVKELVEDPETLLLEG
jgi:2-oxoglutarate dehydrogenase E2 component (dihydrolipoamide succinyltransferase)